MTALLPTPKSVAILTLMLGAGACGRPAAPDKGASVPTAETAHPTGQPVALPTPALAKVGGAAVIADIVERVLPSVVSVSSTRMQRPSAPSDPFFHRFFDQGGPQQGLGSGVAVAKDIIVTNHHVVADADEIKVTTFDGKELQARIVGTDKKSDIAVLKIEGGELKPLAFGDSSRLRLGDVVLAIGNPFGVGQTVTMGIVSAKGRADVGIVDYEDFIQTDAAINPGNSGGALVDMEGNLVGINTAILSRSGGYQGIGFAIPSNMAKPILESLRKDGHVVRGWLGVTIQDLDQDLAQALGLGETKGVLIADVHSDGPAAKAGIRRGDVVLSIEGTAVDSTGRLRNVVAAAGGKKQVKVTLLRGGKRESLDVTLGVAPEDRRAASGQAPSGGESVLAGLRVEGLTPEWRSRLKLGDEVKGGVVIAEVDRSSVAARAGLRPGDVILEVNRRKVDSPAAFRGQFAASKRRALLLVQREGATLFVVVKK
ncbi:MAG: Do family serine endopeptidase [Polyangiaceae bacterium]